ncbi:MAG: DUF5687 family protein [Bacteroidales bacterium]|nr:DUF5687 family protein [Bacteroidales bacterium]
MFKWFLSNQWKEMTRSSLWQKSLVVNLIIGFFVLLMCLYLIALGVFIDSILKELYPDKDPFLVLNGGLLYYFGIDLLIRFFLYKLPVIRIESYLHLPIKKSKILNFILLKSSINIFNLLPLLVFIPFCIKVIAPYQSGTTAVAWLCLMFIMILNNSFLLHYLKRKFVDKPFAIISISILIAATIALDKAGIIPMSEYSSIIFTYLSINPIYIAIPLLILVLVYQLNYSFLKSRLTLEEINVKKKKKIDSLSKITYFNSLGELGEMLMLEFKLMWRNKHSRTIIAISPFLLLYGLIFYPQETYLESFGFLIFVGVFITGGTMFNYGHYIFSWESSYFDFILSNNISSYKHVKAKYIVIVISLVLSYILTLPYAFFGTKVFVINTATFLFNLGFTSFLLLYFASNSKTRIDMSKGSTFNFQGVGATNWILILPFLILPILIWYIFSLFGVPYWGITCIGAIGIIGIMLNKPLLKIAAKRFENKKYEMAKGFREP